jgi:hypothetical protein
MLHEDDILIEARGQRVPQRKDLLRGYADSSKSDDDDEPHTFMGEQVTCTQHVISLDGALSEFSATFVVLLPQQPRIYIPGVPLRKKEPRLLKASVRSGRRFALVSPSQKIKEATPFIWSVLIEGGQCELLQGIRA